MKLPRDLSSDDLIKKLSELGYEVSRQTGSHISGT
ncbi:type II toxin-antitoxin system HicA family toxin [Microcystis viridis]|nr:type II toxin-antitoxin system HicA family toxin [Microcystis viridis]